MVLRVHLVTLIMFPLLLEVLSLEHQSGPTVGMPFVSQGSNAMQFQPHGPTFPNVPYSVDGPMFPQVSYPTNSYMMLLSFPSMYPDFTNVYGFIGNGNPPKSFPNSNTGSRSFSSSKCNGGYKGSTFGNR